MLIPNFLKDDLGNLSSMRLAVYGYFIFSCLLLTVITIAWIVLNAAGHQVAYPETVASAIIASNPVAFFAKAYQKQFENRHGKLPDEVAQ